MNNRFIAECRRLQQLLNEARQKMHTEMMCLRLPYREDAETGRRQAATN